MCFFLKNLKKNQKKKRNKEAVPKKEAGGDAKHVYIFTWPNEGYISPYGARSASTHITELTPFWLQTDKILIVQSQMGFNSCIKYWNTELINTLLALQSEQKIHVPVCLIFPTFYVMHISKIYFDANPVHVSSGLKKLKKK